MYYDSYEMYFGDGFYPLLYKEFPNYSEIDITFEIYGNNLVQLSGPKITGYDGTTYQELLKMK